MDASPVITVDTEAMEINQLHADAHAHAETAIKKAILCGTKLAAKKASLPHGKWLPWVEENLTFGERTARRYIGVAMNRTRVSDLNASSIREAVRLLAEPEEPPAKEPEELQYRNDPELEAKLKELGNVRSALSNTRKDLERTEKKLQKLETLEDQRDEIEKTLKDIQELKKRKNELFKDAESTKVILQALSRGREFFTKECMQIAALKLRPEAIKAMRRDFEGLIELVENWLSAMKERFL